MYIPEPSFVRMPIAGLPPAYGQRRASSEWVKKKVKEFDFALLGVAKISRRPSGDLAHRDYLIDGQNRSLLLEAVGQASYAMPCLIYYNLTPEQEAWIFTETQKMGSQRPLTSREEFHSLIRYGDAESIDIANIIAESGIYIRAYDAELGKFVSHGCENGKPTKAVRPIQGIYRTYGPSMLRRVLRLVNQTWGTDKNPYTFYSIGGVGSFLADYGDRVDDNRFVEQLRPVPFDDVNRAAAALKTTVSGGQHSEADLGRVARVLQPTASFRSYRTKG
jgi:hypothetical protein